MMTRGKTREVSRRAIEWFRNHGRDLPWRRTRDPYAILVSEVMLQQTTVAVVRGYYPRFLERFPTVEALANAEEQDVLTLWAGLGYYRRARLLHEAARYVVRECCGAFPDSVTELQKLPGVGRYTAGAVASFAFDKPAPVVEANTARLLARLFAIRGQLASPAVRKQLWNAAEALLPVSGGGEHNSALMDLGALICSPAAPRCTECPLALLCRARQAGLVDEIPAPVFRAEKQSRRFWGVALRRPDGKYLVRRIPAGEWHAGLYEFPKTPVPDQEPEANSALRISQALGPVSVCSGSLERFAELGYVITSHRVTLTVWRASASDLPVRRKRLLPENYSWKSLCEIAQLPLASAQKRLLQLLVEDEAFFGTGTP